MSAIQILKKEKANQIASENGSAIPQSVMDNWDVMDLIGVREFDVSQLWDFIAHSIDKMIIEVSHNNL